MKDRQLHVDGVKTFVSEFKTIAEFYDYLTNTPYNDAFRKAEKSSARRDRYKIEDSQTRSFEEAVHLLKTGWSDMSQKLVNKLKVIDQKNKPIQKRRTFNSMAGYQPIVPLYLAGVPNNMVSSKMVPVKQKVVNIVKLFNYSASVSSEQIIDESIKVLQVIKKLEQSGYSVNVDIALGSGKYNTNLAAVIRIKNANERLNVSKLAFPLVHPSMLRRLLFKYIEVNPNTTKSFVDGYGMPMSLNEMKQVFPDSVVIPAIWTVDVNKISSVDDIK